MNALVFDSAGDPCEVLRLDDIAPPRPCKGEVLVKVTARPIQPADLLFIRGSYRIVPRLPQIAGLEGVGEVQDGPHLEHAPPGTRVAFRWPGSWAEFAAIPSDRLIPVPAGITEGAASQISLNPITAWALLDEIRASAGDWIIVTAGASTVARLIAAIAKRCGVRTIGIVRGAPADGIAEFPVDRMLSSRDPELLEKIAELTGDAKVTALLDSVGGPGLPTLFTTLKAGARIIAYGLQDPDPAAITNAMLIYGNLTWKGFGIDRWLTELPQNRFTGMIEELWSMIRNESLPLPVEATHPLADFPAALADNAKPGRLGKVLLTSYAATAIDRRI